MKTYVPEEILRNQRMDRPVRAIMRGGKYWVLDARGQRLIVLDAQEHFLRQLGSFGHGPENLFDPTDFCFDRNGNVYVNEAGNKRVTIFDENSRRIGGFPATELSIGIGVSSKGEIVLNQPKSGFLFSIYGSDGSKKGQFGALGTPPAAFSVHEHHDASETYNRMNFVLDDSDNTYAAWWFEPRVQKYGSDGKLIWDVRLAGPMVDALERMANDGTAYYKYNGAGVILSGVAWDASSNSVYVLFPSRTLYVSDKDGKKMGEVDDPRMMVWPFSSVSKGENGTFLFTDTNMSVYSATSPIL